MDDKEYNKLDSAEYNTFSEFIPFKAEEYRVLEQVKSPLEIESPKEYFNDVQEEKSIKKSNSFDKKIEDEIKDSMKNQGLDSIGNNNVSDVQGVESGVSTTASTSSSIASSSTSIAGQVSTALTATVAVVSAATIGVVPITPTKQVSVSFVEESLFYSCEYDTIEFGGHIEYDISFDLSFFASISYSNNDGLIKKEENLAVELNEEHSFLLSGTIEPIIKYYQFSLFYLDENDELVLFYDSKLIECTYQDRLPDILISEYSIVDSSTPGKVSIEGDIIGSADSVIIKSKFNQYLNSELIKDEVVELTTIDSNNHFKCEFDAYSTMNKYQIVIYYSFGGNDYTLYDSGIVEYTLNSNYLASYSKISPLDSQITFNNDNTYTVSINTGFTSEYPEIYRYQVRALDELGNEYASYSGTDANVDLVVSNIENLYLEYSDIGVFTDGEKIYDTQLISDHSRIKVPKLTFQNEYGFDDMFILYYSFDSIYDTSNTVIDLNIETETNTYPISINSPYAEDQINLDFIEGEPNNVKITGTITFTDPTLDSYQHIVNIDEFNIALNYKFDVTQISANYALTSSEAIELTYKLDYILPYSYKIKAIYGAPSGDALNEEVFELGNNEIVFSCLNRTDGGSVTLQAYDESNNPFGVAKTITLEGKSSLESKYQPLDGLSFVNPGDAIVTYNDDGTINIYRDMGVTSQNNTSSYYDALIFNTADYDESYNIINFNGSYHALSNERISCIENVDMQYYSFYYYNVYKENDIYYYLSSVYPSGGLVFDFDTVSATGSYNAELDKTTITIYNDKHFYFENLAIIDGVTYQFNDYTNSQSSTYTFEVSGNVIGKEIKCNLNGSLNPNSLQTISDLVEIKGNLYYTYTFTIASE